MLDPDPDPDPIEIRIFRSRPDLSDFDSVQVLIGYEFVYIIVYKL